MADRILGWNTEQITKFQASWKGLRGDDETMKNLGVKLIIWMINNITDMRTLFKKFSAQRSDDALKADPAFQAHCQLVISSLDALIAKMGQGEAFEKDVRGLMDGHMRKSPPVEVKYFKDFRDKVPLFLKSAAGLDETSEPTTMFKQFLDGFVKVYEGKC